MIRTTTRFARISKALLCAAITLTTQQSVFAGSLSNINVTTLPPKAPVPKSLFGLNLNDILPKEKTTNFPQQAGLFKVWRILVQGGNDVYWGNIQTTKGGSYDWTTMDEYVALAQQYGVDIMYPCTWTPTWAVSNYQNYPINQGQSVAMADNPQDFINYITALVTRYKGQIKYYESWNEPDIPGEYSGTGAQLATYQQELYQTVKAIDPNAIVLSPSFVDQPFMLKPHQQPNVFTDYLAAGGLNYMDAQGWHLYVYPATPESMIPYISYIRSNLATYGFTNTQIFNTECGWSSMTDSVPTKQPGYMARAYLAAWANGVTNFDYFAWNPTGGNIATSLLTNGDGQNSSTFPTLDPAGLAYVTLQGWLVGNRMLSYGATNQASNIYASELVSPKGTHSVIVWTSDDSSQTYKIAPNCTISSAIDINNNPVTISGSGNNRTCPIGPNPVLLVGPVK